MATDEEVISESGGEMEADAESEPTPIRHFTPTSERTTNVTLPHERDSRYPKTAGIDRERALNNASHPKKALSVC
ncbi:hypothetical protein [Caballeronia ptereochthonis]|uniref:hypothetical protein n=1 Tax=Caballeronia ptereochthonis TaxID=1777144 RepID=UPI00117F184F|nr:hypothetical protein [Caballeronia ptereochthonis]